MIIFLTFLTCLGVGGIKAAADHHDLPQVRVRREERQMDRDSRQAFDHMIRISTELSDGEK